MPLYETKSLRGPGPYLCSLMIQGYKRCNPCGMMIKHDGNRCPFCGQKHAIRFLRQTAGTVSALIEMVKATPKRRCSDCGSTTTVTRYKASGAKYFEWLRDGKGGYICSRCYGARKRRASRASKTVE